MVELIGLCVGMYAHAAEVGAECLLHRSTHAFRQRLAATTRALDGLLHTGIHHATLGAGHALDGRRLPADARHRPGCPTDHLLRQPVGLALIPVVGRAKHEFGLDDWRGCGARDYPLHMAVAIAALELEQGGAGTAQLPAAGLAERS